MRTDRALQAFDRRLNARSTAPLAVALSGGSDSTALLLLAIAWARRHDRRVLALVVDHQLSPQSAAWTASAVALARRHSGVEAQALIWTGVRPAAGLPAAARQARHRLLANAARAAGATAILLGHTLDDLAEAQVMREGGSTVGSPREWTPSPVWPQGRGLFHFRPLLGERRQDLRDQLRAQGVGWIDDPANSDLKYARARARAALGGEVREVAPAAECDALSALGAGCDADGWGGLSLPLAALLEAPQSAARRFFQAMLTCASGRETPPRAARVEALLGRLREGAGRAVLGGARVQAANGRLSATREPGERARGGLADLQLQPGQTVVWDGRFEFAGEACGAIGPLAGLGAALAPEERRRLKEVPSAGRGAMPVLTTPGGNVTCPFLAPVPGLNFRVLAGDRLRAACGLIVREQ